MNRTALICSFLCVLTISGPSKAQLALKASDKMRSFGLKEAIESAHKENAQVKISKNFILQSEARQRRALAGYLPKLQLGVANNFNLPVAEIEIGKNDPVTITISPLWVFDLQLTLTQPVFDMNALSAMKIAKLESEKAKKDQERVVFETDVAIINAYHEAARAKLAIEVAKNTISRVKALLNRTQKRFELGLARKSDISRIELELVTAQETHETASSAYKFALGALGVIMGVDEEFEINPILPVQVIENQSTSELIKRALIARKDLSSQKASLKLAKKNHDRVYDSFYPTLSAQAQGFYTTNATGLSASALRGVFVLQGTWTMYDGGDRYGRMRETKSMIHAEEIKLNDLKMRIEADVRGKIRDIQTKSKTTKRAEKKLRLQKEIYADAKKSFLDGLLETTEVINLAHDLNNFELSAKQAKLELSLARIQLAHMTGDLEQN